MVVVVSVHSYWQGVHVGKLYKYVLSLMQDIADLREQIRVQTIAYNDVVDKIATHNNAQRTIGEIETPIYSKMDL